MNAGFNTIELMVTDSAGKTSITSTTVQLVYPYFWDANGTASGQTNGGGAWLGNNLWWNGTANTNWVSGSSAVFGGAATNGGSVTLASPTTVDSITINQHNGTYTLGSAGQPITLNAGIDKTALSSTVSIISPVVLGAGQTWANHSTGNLTVTGVISGSGGITKTGSGTLILQAAQNANNYTGNTRVLGGILQSGTGWSNADNIPGGMSGSTGSGQSNLELNGGTFTQWYHGTRTLGTGPGQIQITGGRSGFTNRQSDSTGRNWRIGDNSSIEIVWGSDYFKPSILVLQDAAANPGTATYTIDNRFDLNGADRTIEVGASTGTLAQPIRNTTGTAGLIKIGNGILILSATNTYNGNTTINAGTLRINVANTNNQTSTVSIAAGATLHLGFNGTDTVDKLFVGGTQLAAGVYKAPGSTASGTELSALAGTGTLTVTSNPLPSGPGPVHHFVISPIASPQTAGTAITGITITAKDANNDTATSFAGTVTYGGTAGITGTSANFIDGVLSGVSVTPVNAGIDLTFTVDDGSGHTGSATVTVLNANQAPVVYDGSVTTDEDTPVAITLVASDIDSTIQSYSIVSGPTNGTLSGIAPNLTYTPNAEFSGADNFTFTASDGELDSNIATISIIVNPVNDAPIASNGFATTDEDTPVAITLVATDIDSTIQDYAIVSGPTNGTLTGTAPNLTYTPNANFNGSDSFTFTANDGAANSNTATVSITVNPVNDAPVASNGSANTNEDTPVAITLVATDIDSAIQNYAIVSSPANGSLSGTAPNLTYTPNANYHGSDSFSFTANDGIADSNTATVSITVNPINDAPVFTVDPIVAVGASEGVAYTGVTLANTAIDADTGDSIAYSKVSGPAWLSVAADGTLSGTPPTGSTGLNTFVVRATDTQSATADATLEITVEGLPLPWISTDIGTGMLAGSASFNDGTFTQAGSGVIGGTSDRFRFTYQTLTGDGEIIARIASLQNTGTSSRVGVMIRESLAANSKQIFAGMTGTNAYRWVRRTSTGGSTSSNNYGTGTVPNTWVRIVRTGNTITTSKSSNGITWTTMGSSTTTFASTCYIGLAVGSGSNTTLNTSQFSNVSVTP
jgi:autotransporter-associated beta strand protein